MESLGQRLDQERLSRLLVHVPIDWARPPERQLVHVKERTVPELVGVQLTTAYVQPPCRQQQDYYARSQRLAIAI